MRVMRPCLRVFQRVRLHARACHLPAQQADASSDPAAAQQQSERDVLVAVTRRIKALGEARKFKEAVAELASLATLGIQPDTQAATALLAACTRSRDMKLAEDIFSQLFGERVRVHVRVRVVSVRGQPPAGGDAEGGAPWHALPSALTALLLPIACSRQPPLQATFCSRTRSRFACCCAATAAGARQTGRHWTQCSRA
jgi:hypothetical protein